MLKPGLLWWYRGIDFNGRLVEPVFGSQGPLVKLGECVEEPGNSGRQALFAPGGEVQLLFPGVDVLIGVAKELGRFLVNASSIIHKVVVSMFSSPSISLPAGTLSFSLASLMTGASVLPGWKLISTSGMKRTVQETRGSPSIWPASKMREPSGTVNFRLPMRTVLPRGQ